MKKFIGASLLAATLLMPTTSFAAQNEIVLPALNLQSNLSVMNALNQRKSSRNFVDKDLTAEQLSKILWAANGVASIVTTLNGASIPPPTPFIRLRSTPSREKAFTATARLITSLFLSQKAIIA